MSGLDESNVSGEPGNLMKVASLSEPGKPDKPGKLGGPD